MTSQALSPLSPTFRLYDPEELLHMTSNVADGYLVLLGGPEAGHHVQIDASALNLAFLALVEGNVIDACFGAKSHVGHMGATPRTDRAMKAANDAKSMLNEAVVSSDSVRLLAVQSYGEAFQVVLQYNAEDKKLNFFTRCFKAKKLRRKAEANLVEAFRPLQEALEAAN